MSADCPPPNYIVLGSGATQRGKPVAALGKLNSAHDWHTLAHRWRRDLARNPKRRCVAELYGGVQWQAAKQVVAAAGPRAQGYVVSPGLGLRPFHWLAPGYSASFAGGPNSAHALARKCGWETEDAAASWWNALTNGGGWERLFGNVFGPPPERPATGWNRPSPSPVEPISEPPELLIVLPAPHWRAVGESLALALQARPEINPHVWLLGPSRIELPKPAAHRLLPTPRIDWATHFGCKPNAAHFRLAAWLLETPLGEWDWEEVANRLARAAARPESGVSSLPARS